MDTENNNRVCCRCIMTDKGDPHISFDENGICNYCTEAIERMKSVYYPNETGEILLKNLVDELKLRNKGKKYDCVMGISGGVDSSYLAYLGAVKWGLRIKAFHVSDGFDTEIAQQNIRSLCAKTGIDLEYIEPDTRQYYELTRAYMLAGVPNLAIPQDNIAVSTLYRFIRKSGIKDFLIGDNFALESILQTGNTWDNQDLANIRDINRRFGRDRINRLPLQSLEIREIYRALKLIRVYTPLDYIDYNLERALKEMHDYFGYEYYGSKHLENYFTGFLQLYWLPRKFGVDKRTSHYSSLIVSGQMTRDEALEKMKESPCSDKWMDKAISLVKQKLELSDNDFDKIMRADPHQHTDYRIDPLKSIKRKLRGIK